MLRTTKKNTTTTPTILLVVVRPLFFIIAANLSFIASTKMIYFSYAWESGEIYNKLLKMRIRLLHGQRGAPTTRGQALLQQPSTSPIRHELSWQPNPTSIDLLHFRMALARRVINSLFASIIDSTHPVASSAAIVPNAQLRLNGREVYRLLHDSYEEERGYIRMMRMIRTQLMMTVRAPPPARLASFGLRSKRG